jgi:D-3-phosphoglycerate dehydrogenase
MTRLRVGIGASSFAAEDLSPLKLLEKYPIEVVRNPYGRKLSESESLEFTRDLDGLLAGLEPLNEHVLSAAPRLRALARIGIGMDNVDQAAAKKKGIKVSNTPEGPTQAVAELTLAAALAIGRGLTKANEAPHRKEWIKEIGVGLSGAQVLLIGFGRIGRRTAELFRVFGAEVRATDPSLSTGSEIAGTRIVGLNDGLKWASIVSLHASGKNSILREAELLLLRPGAILLNSARGELVDETSLIAALDRKQLRGAWLDTFAEEPYSGPLTNRPEVLLTPHIATYTRQCRLDMEMAAVNNLLRDLGLLL